MRGLRLRQAFRSNASNIERRPAGGFASRAVVLSFVAGERGGRCRCRIMAAPYSRLSEMMGELQDAEVARASQSKERKCSSPVTLTKLWHRMTRPTEASTL
jgi:hypothetical protein